MEKDKIYIYGARKWAKNFMPQWNGRECVILKRYKKPRNCMIKFLDNGQIEITNIGLLGLKRR